jgi:hypothetical protein
VADGDVLGVGARGDPARHVLAAYGPASDTPEPEIVAKESWHDKYLEWICGYANAKDILLRCFREQCN